MVLVFLLTIAAVAAQVPPEPSPTLRLQEVRRSQDFGFRFEFGCGSPDIYDSFGSTFTRSWDSKEQKIRVGLSAEQMDRICRTIRDIDFFSYPEHFSGVPQGLREVTVTTPHQSYLLEVRNNGAVHRVRWNESLTPWTDQATRIRSLFLLITEYLRAHPDVARLPRKYPCE